MKHLIGLSLMLFSFCTFAKSKDRDADLRFIPGEEVLENYNLYYHKYLVGHFLQYNAEYIPLPGQEEKEAGLSAPLESEEDIVQAFAKCVFVDLTPKREGEKTDFQTELDLHYFSAQFNIDYIGEGPEKVKVFTEVRNSALEPQNKDYGTSKCSVVIKFSNHRYVTIHTNYALN